MGHCHTVEAWREAAGRRALRRVARPAFFGESMFSRERDASKICLVHLVERLNERALHAARHAVHHRASEALRRGRRAAPKIREAAGKSAGRRSAVLSLAVRPRQVVVVRASLLAPSGRCDAAVPASSDHHRLGRRSALQYGATALIPSLGYGPPAPEDCLRPASPNGPTSPAAAAVAPGPRMH